MPFTNRLRGLLGDKFSQGVIWNIVSLGIAGVCGIVVNYLVGEVYGPASLGVFNQVFAVYVVASQLAALGIHGSVLAHVAARSDDSVRRAVVTSGLVAAAGTTVVLCGAFLALAHPIASLLSSSDVAIGIFWATPGLFCFSLNKVVLAALNGLGRMRWFAVFQAGRFVFMALGFALCSALHAPRTSLPVILSISEVATFLVSIGTIRTMLGRVGLEELREWTRVHLAFGVRGFLYGLFFELNNRLAIIILGAFVSDDQVGAYSLAALVCEGVSQILVALRTNYAPVAVRMAADGRLKELADMVRRASKKVYLAAVPIGALVVLGYALVVPAISSEPGLAASWVYFAVLVAGTVAGAGYAPFNQLLLWAHRPGWHSLMMIAVVGLGALLDVALVATLGVLGLACAVALSYALAVLAFKLFVRRVLDLRV